MKAERTLKVAAVQLSSQDDKKQNIEKALELIGDARESGAKLVALPEMFNCYSTLEEMVKRAEPVPGPTISTLAQEARRHGLYILCGSIIEATTDGKCFNTSVIIGPEGNILAIYRKIHLFDIDIPGKVRFKESDKILPGNETVTVNVNGWTVGLAICYDLRFPEIFSNLTSKGAELILIPSAFSAHTGKDHWEVLIRARAIENQVFIMAPNRSGTSRNNIATYGHSLIVDPWGAVLSQALEKECIISSKLDAGILEDVRKRLPVKRANVNAMV